MKASSRFSGKATLGCGVLAVFTLSLASGQTLVNLATQGRNIDFSNAPSTRPEKTGASLPATCLPGQLFFNSNAAPGQNLYLCVVNNTWSVVGAGLSDPGANGLVVRTAQNTTAVVAAPAGAVVGTTDTQTLTNKSISASEITSGTLSSAQLPALTGDVSSTAGSAALTLAAVNSSPGTFGDNAHAVQITVDAKGRVTGIAQLPIGGSSAGYQTVETQGSALTQRSALNLSSAFSAVDNSSAARTDVDLATVNASPGTYGDGMHAIQLTADAKGRITGISQVAISAGAAASNYQTVEQQGAAVTQRPALDLSAAFAVSDNSASTRTEVDLASVNANVGTFGSTSQIPVLTVNNKGLITGISTVAASASGNSVPSGTLASLPFTCTAGALYVATDQPAGQQLYICSSANTWTQTLALGPSGALAVNNGLLDIVTGIVPRLSAANSFTGVDSFSGGVQLTTTTAAQPACSAGTRGLFWFQNNGSAKDSLQVCVFNGTSFIWNTLY